MFKFFQTVLGCAFVGGGLDGLFFGVPAQIHGAVAGAFIGLVLCAENLIQLKRVNEGEGT